MLTLLGIGFLIGITGSMHCFGMCGPLALLIASDPSDYKFVDPILYHLGRMTSYLFIGILVGIVGISIGLLKLEQYFSIFLGIFLLTITIFGLNFGGNKSINNFKSINIFTSYLRKLISNHLKILPMYFKGLLNGFLPCGLVLVAISTGAGLTSMTDSLTLMLGFGLGTMPMMLLVSLTHPFFPKKTRKIMGHLAPIVSIIMSFLLIIRGLNLGIPYLSPYIDRFDLLQSVIHCH